MSKLTIDNLTFSLRRSDKRKTLGITIERDGDLVLLAPSDTPLEEIERAARAKGLWIHRKLAERAMVAGPGRAYEYVPGETFDYLGRSYRLRLADPSPDRPALQLRRGWFELRRDELEHGQRHFTDWYAAHGGEWLAPRVELLARRVGVDPGPIRVQELGYRWASCGRAGALNFHWRTLQLPARIIDYVVLHELVHLVEPRHDIDFWRRVERAMPDFLARKRWLAERGSEY